MNIYIYIYIYIYIHTHTHTLHYTHTHYTHIKTFIYKYNAFTRGEAIVCYVSRDPSYD